MQFSNVKWEVAVERQLYGWASGGSPLPAGAAAEPGGTELNSP